ncbi:MAG: 50S ribosomal protein L21 [Planctomycetaceae bacterium]|jgi:large subunit ribosomal protein L21|nr:50S ribosomal protein L21 [Planctomycetaceae bacterium]
MSDVYAIIVDGGRQYKVTAGQLLDIDFREGAETGENVLFGNVLAIGGGESGLKIGTPTVSGASVKATVVGLQKGEKVFIQKFNRRKNYRRRTGHRQLYTRIKIDAIEV